MDGIDVALVRTDGIDEVEFGPTLAIEYDSKIRRLLAQGLDDAVAIEDREDRPGQLRELEEIVTQRHADAVLAFLSENQLSAKNIDLIGFHGQTVLHRPEQGVTVQLGLGQVLADAVGIDTVYDFRAADMLAGGQGAPLVPVFHRALANRIDRSGPVCFVNIGGISNITYVDSDDVVAFDSGPGNALIDQWVEAKGGIPFDQGGRIASEGRIVQPIADQYLQSAFFDRSGPKSLDRNDFLPLESDTADLSDGARTLAHVTAASIIKSGEHLPKPPSIWIICGGGRLNSIIIADLKALAKLHDAEVILAEEAQLQGDMLEAQAFGYLAVRSQKNLPLTFCTTTGCRRPISGGKIAAANISSLHFED